MSQYAIALVYGQNEGFELLCTLPEDVTDEQAKDIFEEERRRYLAKLPEHDCAIVPQFKLLLVPVWEHTKNDTKNEKIHN